MGKFRQVMTWIQFQEPPAISRAWIFKSTWADSKAFLEAYGWEIKAFFELFFFHIKVDGLFPNKGGKKLQGGKTNYHHSHVLKKKEVWKRKSFITVG